MVALVIINCPLSNIKLMCSLIIQFSITGFPEPVPVIRNNITVVFFQILTQRGRLIQRVAMVTEEGRYTGTAMETTYLDTLFPAGHSETFNDLASVSFLSRQFQLRFEISPENLMRGRLSEVHDNISASYLRWSAAATLQSGCGNQPLHGISEYIRIRPAVYEELSI